MYRLTESKRFDIKYSTLNLMSQNGVNAYLILKGNRISTYQIQIVHKEAN